VTNSFHFISRFYADKHIKCYKASYPYVKGLGLTFLWTLPNYVCSSELSLLSSTGFEMNM